MVTGKCSLQDGVRLKALASGIEVVPYDVSTHDAIGDFRWLRSEISRPAGDVFLDNAVQFEPVEFIAGGVTIARYMYFHDGLELSDDRAFLNLEDPLKILERGYISASYDDDDTIAEAILDILDEADISIGETEPISGINVQEVLNISEVDYDSTRSRLASGEVSAIWQGSSGGHDFIEISPFQALNEVVNDAGVEVTTDRNGELVIGNQVFVKENTSDSIYQLTGDTAVDDIRIQQYNVGRTGNKIKGNAFKTPLLKGSELTDVLDSEDDIRMAGRAVEAGTEIQGFAYAFVEGIDGDVEDVAPKEITDLDDLESHSVNELFNAWSTYNNGNIVFNTASSTQHGQYILGNTDPGDLIEVIPSQNAEDEYGENQSLCGQRVYGGMFSINSVKHNFNTRVGWETVISTSLLPPNYSTEKYWVDKNTGQFYDSLQEIHDDLVSHPDPIQDEIIDSVDDIAKDVWDSTGGRVI